MTKDPKVMPGFMAEIVFDAFAATASATIIAAVDACTTVLVEGGGRDGWNDAVLECIRLINELRVNDVKERVLRDLGIGE